MNDYMRRIGTTLIALGLDPRKLLHSIINLPIFLYQALIMLSKQSYRKKFKIYWVPILSDRHMPAGKATRHYFHQDIWAARKVYEINPKKHIDVGSRIDGFVAHLLSFRSVTVMDVRSLQTNIMGLTFQQGDLMKEIPINHSADSVSCLHALEHFGLGRYGDPLDLDGWKKGLVNLANMTAIDGYLYISVPIGNEQRIEFNAQRVFLPETLPTFMASLGLELVEFSWINDEEELIERDSLTNAKCKFGCGCYIFRKGKY